jgi:hypothetical protein
MSEFEFLIFNPHVAPLTKTRERERNHFYDVRDNGKEIKMKEKYVDNVF